MRTAVFTIASSNYFALVKTLMESLENSNPEYERYVAVADVITDEIQNEAKSFNLLSIEDLELPEEKKMLFRYDVLELNTAIKPFVFRTIFNKLGFDRVIYFDPDIYVYKGLSVLETIFNEGYEIVLTPHLTTIYDDSDGIPNDLDILKSGVYNLGFLALSKSLNTMNLVHWWMKKLEFQCVASFKDGLFVDQKWMDIVPGMFEHVYILKDAGYNVAYWNLTHRKAELIEKNELLFNGQPLTFFHFSGLNPKDINSISKYQNRFDLNSLNELKGLFEVYAGKVLSNGYDYYRTFKYAYNYFCDGNYISELFRKIYRKDEKLIQECGGNPFDAESVFYHNRIRIISMMLELIWYEREEIRMIHPTVNSEEYVGWFLNTACREYGLSSEFLEGVSIASVLNVENYIRAKVRRKYQLKMFVKRYSTEKAWNRYRKLFRRFWKKN